MAKGHYGNAEAVVLNPQPFVNFFLRQQQQKRLDKQALDKQINDDLTKLSPDGMRQQDVDPFLRQYQNLKNLSIEYRDAIRNPAQNPKAWRDYQNNKSQLMGTIAKSKSRKEGKKALIDFYNKNHDKIDTDTFRQAMNKYDAPVGTPEFDEMEDFDPTDTLFKAPQMDLNKLYTPINQLKPEESQEIQQLPNGQVRKIRTKQINPGAVAQYMSMAYGSDSNNAKKYFDDLYNTIPTERLTQLEDYAQQHFDPEFTVKSPEDLAVASGIYGRVNKNVLNDLTGADLNRRESFQQRLQNQRLDRADLRAERSAGRKDAKDSYIWEANMGEAMQHDDFPAIEKLYTELESSTPGVEKVYLKEGATPANIIKTWKRNMGETGLDGKTKTLKDADFKSGVLVVAVPKIVKDVNGNEVKAKDARGRDQYEYMAVSSRDPYKANRLNKLKNYALGGSIKPLSDKIYKNLEAQPVREQSEGNYELDPTNEEQ